jgi:hypothetical protein
MEILFCVFDILYIDIWLWQDLWESFKFGCWLVFLYFYDLSVLSSSISELILFAEAYFIEGQLWVLWWYLIFFFALFVEFCTNLQFPYKESSKSLVEVESLSFFFLENWYKAL